MTSTIYFIRDNRAIKKPWLLSISVFLIYAPRILKFPSSLYTDYDSGLATTTPDHCAAYYCSKDREVKQFLDTTNRLWLGLLNKFFSKDIVINKGEPLGFFVIKTNRQFSVKHEAKR